MFSGAISFTSDLSNWDVSRVTSMKCVRSSLAAFPRWLTLQRPVVHTRSEMFYEVNLFTSDLSRWDVSQVTYMGCVQ